MNKEGIVNEGDIKRLLRKDKLFGAIYKKYGAPPAWSREPGFVSLSMIILEQQVSLASATAHFQRRHSSIGEYTPTNVLRLSDEKCAPARSAAKKPNSSGRRPMHSPVTLSIFMASPPSMNPRSAKSSRVSTAS